MAIRNIITLEDEKRLRKKSRKVEKFDEKLWELLDDMRETLTLADGAGLAAPQVGVLRRIVLVDVDETVFELINPEIMETEGEQCLVEGCLSVPGDFAYVVRPEKIKVKYFDRYGNEVVKESEGPNARVFCHEIDHLDGVLFVDKVFKYYKPQEEE